MFKGRYTEADAAYEKAIDLAFKTYGPHHWRYWHETAYYARMLHMRGKRLQALRMFESLEKNMPTLGKGLDDSFEDGQIAFVWGQWGRCFSDEGRPLLAIPLLQATENYYEKSESFDSDLLRLRFALADAYDRAGLRDQAKQLFEKVVADYERRGRPNDKELQVVHERWAQFLIEEKSFSQAEMLLQSIIAQSPQGGSSVPARAYGDLASASIAQNQMDKALQYSGQALQSLKNDTDLYNIRLTTLLWRIHAQALLGEGDSGGARAFAQRALVADQQ